MGFSFKVWVIDSTGLGGGGGCRDSLVIRSNISLHGNIYQDPSSIVTLVCYTPENADRIK